MDERGEPSERHGLMVEDAARAPASLRNDRDGGRVLAAPQCERLPVTLLALFVLLIVAVGALTATITERSHDRGSNPTIALGLALVCSLVAIPVLTLVPNGGTNERQLIPLVRIIDLRPLSEADTLLNVMGNILLFLPLGAALCLLGFRIRTTIFIAFSLSALVELTQLFVPGRTTSVDDVLLNTLGALVGHALLSRWAPAWTTPGSVDSC